MYYMHRKTSLWWRWTTTIKSVYTVSTCRYMYYGFQLTSDLTLILVNESPSFLALTSIRIYTIMRRQPLTNMH